MCLLLFKDSVSLKIWLNTSIYLTTILRQRPILHIILTLAFCHGKMKDRIKSKALVLVMLQLKFSLGFASNGMVKLKASELALT